MIRDLVKSSYLLSVGYDHSSNTLEIEFKNRSICKFYHVPVGIYQSLMRAQSKGTYFNKFIKNAYMMTS